MDGKLIKKEDDFYSLRVDGLVMATSNGMLVDHKLSLKNCQEVADGHDLDIYIEAIDYASSQGHPDPAGFSDKQVGLLHGYIDGFQKAIEVLGDKKFSEEQVKKAINLSWEEKPMLEIKDIIQSLQQTEWDVEIVMEYQGFEEDGKVREAYISKLDADGCLILKRK